MVEALGFRHFHLFSIQESGASGGGYLTIDIAHSSLTPLPPPRAAGADFSPKKRLPTGPLDRKRVYSIEYSIGTEMKAGVI